MGEVRPLRAASGVLITDDLLDSWTIHMEASGLASRTIKIYLTQVNAWRDWCVSSGQQPALQRDIVVAFLASERARGLAANSVKTRFRAINVLANWLHDEGLAPANALRGVKVPTPVLDPPPVLSEEDLAALIRACAGTRFIDRRDAAALRLLMDTGMRASECVGIQLDDLQLRKRLVTVHGKGGRTRTIPFEGKTAVALDRYLRQRRTHRYADHPALWLGERGPLAYDGLSYALAQRAERAEIEGFHLHRLRHTLAHRWLAAGGSELGLQDVAGWTSPAMLARYGASARAERAIAEANRLHLNQDL